MKNPDKNFSPGLIRIIIISAVIAAFLLRSLCGCAPSFAAGPAGEALTESSQASDPVRKIAELSYKMARPSKIRKLTITPPAGQASEKRAKKIEILTSEFETEEDTYWLSSGFFTLDGTAETIICEFEPVEAQYIKIRILECRGPEIYPDLGKVTIGLNSFKLIGNVVDFDGGAPVSSAEVYIHGEKKAESNHNGDFIIEDCEYSTLEISLKARGYHDISESAPVFSGKKISMAFRMKKHSYTVYGRITDSAGGNPIALASVTLSLKDPAGSSAAATRGFITDEFGYYYAGFVQSGSYEICASAEDYSDLVKFVGIDSSKSYVINFIMKSKVDLGPLEAGSVHPSAGEAFTDEVRVVFNKSVKQSCLTPDNFLVSLNEGTGGVEIKQSPVDITEVYFSPDDPQMKTVVLKIYAGEKFSAMPAVDVNIFNITDIYGVKISEKGVMISNRKGASH
jgi:hypothetical protein